MIQTVCADRCAGMVMGWRYDRLMRSVWLYECERSEKLY